MIDTALGLLFAALVTLSFWWYGKQSRKGPILALAAQGAFAVIVLRSGAWSMAFGWIAITVVQIVNLRRWVRKEP